MRTGRSVTQKPLLLVPIQRQLDGAREPRRAQVDGLLAFEDRFDDAGDQEGEGDQPPNIALGDALAGGDGLEPRGRAQWRDPRTRGERVPPP